MLIELSLFLASGGPGQTIGGASETVQEFEYDADGFPIIPEDHDMMRTDTRPASTQPATAAGGAGDPIDIDSVPDVDMPPDAQTGAAGVKVCPHCTFENPPGSVDCEICSLPLNG